MKNLMKQITKNFLGDLFYFLSYFGNANACMGIC